MEKQAQDDATRTAQQFVTFVLSGEIFGVDVNQVQEIISYQHFNRLPEQPDYMPGVFDLRGAVVPAVDLRIKFGLEAKEYDSNTVILVLNTEGKTMGVVVDAVSDVLTLYADDIQPPPELAGKARKDYIEAMGKKDDELVIILDIDKLLGGMELGEADQASPEAESVAEAG
ncbi:MAG: purine-binding chemotaxis protein CheW [Deltaproteobacteria bacterium]|nr:purine-binding chemotaxis protein CheW [Deltaproteobacteria bacterium]